MATYRTYDAKGLRESLGDMISNISPEETPIVSAIGKGKARATFEEWQTDVLAASNKDNAIVEGADATYAAPTPTKRLGNYTQISVKDFMISSTMEAVNKAGRKSEIAYQLMKQGKELRTDIEAAVSQNNAAAAGDGVSVARKSAGLETWAFEVNSHGTGTPNGSTVVVTAGAPTTAPTDAGTTRAFTETLLKDVLSAGYSKGARYSMMVAPPKQKQAASTLTGLASSRINVAQNKKGQAVVVGAADIYLSDFGEISIVPSQHMRAKTVLLLDPEYFEIRYLQDFNEKEMSRTGQAEKHQIAAEWTLCVKNPRAVAKVADLS